MLFTEIRKTKKKKKKKYYLRITGIQHWTSLVYNPWRHPDGNIDSAGGDVV